MARASRAVDDPVTDPVTGNVMIVRTATITVSATAAAEATVTIAATTETAGPKVKTRLIRSSRLPMPVPVQRILVVIKTVSSRSVHGVDADVAVASVTTTDQPITQWRIRLRASQTTKQPKRSQNPLVSRIDGGPLTSATRDDAEDSVRLRTQIPLKPK
tara:strand:- start:17 stop:493 length:477 start_codon:yes stop_codon:yes gene_type:complete